MILAVMFFILAATAGGFGLVLICQECEQGWGMVILAAVLTAVGLLIAAVT